MLAVLLKGGRLLSVEPEGYHESAREMQRVLSEQALLTGSRG